VSCPFTSASSLPEGVDRPLSECHSPIRDIRVVLHGDERGGKSGLEVRLSFPPALVFL
jgi:hypothetical protein